MAGQPIPGQTGQTEQQRAATLREEEERRAAAAALAEKQRQEEEARKATAEAAKKRLEDEARQKAAQAEAARRLEEKRRAEEVEARTRAARPAPAALEAVPSGAAPTPSATGAAPANAWDGVYAGSLSVSSRSGTMAGLRPLAADLRVAGGQVTGQLILPACGPMDVVLAIAPSGAVSGMVSLYEAAACSRNSASVIGKMSANALTLEIRGINMSARGTLSRRTD